MPYQTLEDIPLTGRNVFIRADLNVPMDGKTILDPTRIETSLPTIRYCIDQGARIIIGTHLGRPQGKPSSELSLEPIGLYLSNVLEREILLTESPSSDGTQKIISGLHDGQIALLENLRFDPGETSNDKSFAQKLASYASVYIGDAFGTAHRAHASITGMIPFVKDYGAGYLMDKEISFLSKLLHQQERPYIAVIGGSQIETKIAVLESLFTQVDTVLIGGLMGNVFLYAMGHKISLPRPNPSSLALARSCIRKAKACRVTLCLPEDIVVTPSIDESTGMIKTCDELPYDGYGLDIGPQTIKTYQKYISEASTIFWNGPMGMFEKKSFSQGTYAIANAIAQNSRALSVVGGGESASAIANAKLTDQISHVSTGGGAAIEFLEGKSLVGINALSH